MPQRDLVSSHPAHHPPDVRSILTNLGAQCRATFLLLRKSVTWESGEMLNIASSIPKCRDWVAPQATLPFKTPVTPMALKSSHYPQAQQTRFFWDMQLMRAA